MKEIWVPIKGYEKRYEVSSLGRIKSLYRGYQGGRNPMMLKPSGDRYPSVDLIKVKGNRGKSYTVHRLVAEHFIPRNDLTLVVNHKDGNKTNNAIDNLEWVTQKENVAHSYRIGLAEGMFGEDNPQAVLTRDKVIYLRNNYGKISTREMAKQFGVNTQTAYKAAKSITWSHI